MEIKKDFLLTLKGLIITTADNILIFFFVVFQRQMILRHQKNETVCCSCDKHFKEKFKLHLKYTENIISSTRLNFSFCTMNYTYIVFLHSGAPLYA